MINQTYGYDARGNRWVAPGSYRPNTWTPDGAEDFTSANRIAQANYDLSGNLTSAPGMPFTFTYDGDNHQIAAVSPGNGSASYFYDAEGRRVKKITCRGPTACTAGTTTTYVYDAMGQLAAEYGGTSSATGTQYLTADHLGSTRLVTDASGGVQERLDYLPFGEGLGLDGGVGVNGRLAQYPRYNGGAYPAVPVDDLSLKFTSKERDAETGLDYFGARYLSSAQGRFTTPDIPFLDQHPADPQSWNLYAYVRNSPLKFLDPTGRACVYSGKGSKSDPGSYIDDDSGGESCDEASSDSRRASVTVTEEGGYFSESWGILRMLDESGQPIPGIAIERPLQDWTVDAFLLNPFMGASVMEGGTAGLAARVASRMGLLRSAGGVVYGEGRNIAFTSFSVQMAEREMTATVFGLSAKPGAAAGAATLELFRGISRFAAAEGASSVRVVANQVGNSALAKSLVDAGFSVVRNEVVNGRVVPTLVRVFEIK